ncbi:unnamed protein product [Spodoptera exigua]|nr:unnamed protein product [Spodoptera exigua]
MSGLTNRVKRGSRGSATLLEAANRILRLLGVSSTKRGKQPSPKSKINGRASSELRAPIAAAEVIVETPIKMQAAPAPAPTTPAPASAAPSAPAPSPAASQAQKPTKRTAKDYIFGKLIGEGCYSTVFLAKDIHSGKEYAIKVCEKLHIIRKKKREYIRREKDALNMLFNVPHGFVKLYCTFQDEERLYFVLSFAKNGELLSYINQVGSFELNVAKFYAAELLMALEKMHAKGIIHRDLKPENILLDENMHLQIADFGTAKILEPEEIRASSNNADDTQNERSRKISFVGTPQYVSPELLHDGVDTRASDLWALGCIIYQMISGLPPFRAATEFLTFQKILKMDFEFPEGFPADAKDLVEKLLVLDHSKRLGATDKGETYDSIRSHPFFAGIEWDNVWDQTPPTISPYLPGGSFEEEYNVPDHLEPGLGNQQLVRLWEFDLSTSKGILNISPEEKRRRLEVQSRESKWHQFVDGELILKQGLVDKRKGLFPRRRMLLLTTGPRLFYVDPANMVLKGEIPWSPQLRVEAKNFRIFLVHTPNRTYYLEDPDSYALEWASVIDEVRIGTYGRDTT